MSIDEICENYGIENYTINNGLVDVDGDVYLNSLRFTELPLKFNKVTGSFTCSYNKLTSLFGCPNYVGGNFVCSDNELTSLEHCPKEVGNDFYCRVNNITDLTGLNKFGGRLYCTENPIGKIFSRVEHDFTYAFQVYQVINGNEINLKRLKYVMSIWDLRIDFIKIREYYKLI